MIIYVVVGSVWREGETSLACFKTKQQAEEYIAMLEADYELEQKFYYSYDDYSIYEFHLQETTIEAIKVNNISDEYIDKLIAQMTMNKLKE